MRGVDLEVYRLPIDALVVACYPHRLIFYFLLHLAEIVEFPAGHVVEFSPLILSCHRRWSVWFVHFMVAWLVVTLRWDVYELENKRSAGYNTRAAGKEVAADDVF